MSRLWRVRYIREAAEKIKMKRKHKIKRANNRVCEEEGE